jgi:DNA-binding MarR family transcriptional regulator
LGSGGLVSVKGRSIESMLRPGEHRAWRGFIRVQASLIRGLDAELTAKHRLPLSSFEVLLWIECSSERRVRLAELADGVLLTRSGLSRLLDRLEAEGLIAREQDPDDGRAFYAVTTVAGTSLLNEARATQFEWIREYFSRHFSHEELDLLGEFWERLLMGATSDRALSR